MEVAPTDIAVVGAGAIGMAIAWRAATAGRTVTLVDDSPGRGASWAAAGMLAPVTEAHFGEEALLTLNHASHARWPAFAAELAEVTSRDSGYRECGTIVVARDLDDLAVVDDLAAFQRSLGLQVERLSSREARQLEPGLVPSIRGGLFVSGDHQVDNRTLVAALSTACHRAGVVTIASRAAAIDRSGSRAQGVVLTDGRRLAAGAVVLAAGAWSASLEGVPDALPVRPVKGQLLHLRCSPGLRLPPPATHNVRVPGGRPGRPAVYVVPRGDGRVVVGATVEERGFDTTVTAGAVLDLLREAYELLPGIAELELTETAVGLRPGTPDNAPLIGSGPLEGLVIATGHFRNGILLAPITAEAVVGLLTTGELPEVAAPFTPDRFARQEVA